MRNNCRSTHTPTHGLASTSRMRTAISPGQWQPWTAVSPLLGLITVGSMNGENPRVSKTLYSRGECKHCFKRQLHTTHVGTVRAGNRTAVLPRHARGRRIRTYPDLCASKFNKVNLKQGAHMPWEKEGEKRRPEMRLLFVGY